MLYYDTSHHNTASQYNMVKIIGNRNLNTDVDPADHTEISLHSGTISVCFPPNFFKKKVKIELRIPKDSDSESEPFRIQCSPFLVIHVHDGSVQCFDEPVCITMGHCGVVLSTVQVWNKRTGGDEFIQMDMSCVQVHDSHIVFNTVLCGKFVVTVENNVCNIL
jgi:hypothetical protein